MKQHSTRQYRIIVVKDPEARFWRRWRWSVEEWGYRLAAKDQGWELLSYKPTGTAWNKREAIRRAVDRMPDWMDPHAIDLMVTQHSTYKPEPDRGESDLLKTIQPDDQAAAGDVGIAKAMGFIK